MDAAHTTDHTHRTIAFRRRLAAGLLIALVLTGCVRRRMLIRSNPPGAMVYVDDYQIGTTPVAHDFTYYGTRKIKLVKDGYQTLTVYQNIPAPWYEVPGIDFFAENLVPQTIYDRHTLEYQLTPQLVTPTDALLDRGETLRQSTYQTSGSLGMPSPVEPIPATDSGPASRGAPLENLPAPPSSLPPSAPAGPTIAPPASNAPGTMPNVPASPTPAPQAVPAPWTLPPAAAAPPQSTAPIAPSVPAPAYPSTPSAEGYGPALGQPNAGSAYPSGTAPMLRAPRR
ncbi:hypothetical protein JCM19992_02780 [Thermostilla marina]